MEGTVGYQLDSDGDLIYPNCCVCPHHHGFRVGYDWGTKLAWFETLEEAQKFAEELNG